MSAAKRKSRAGGRPTREQAALIEERLRQAALEAFVRDGFDGVTMEQVARAAEVSKHTLYARYPDKRALFTSIVPWAMESLDWLDHVADVDPDDLVGALTTIARSARRRALDPDVVRLIRMVIGESPRFPEVALTADEVGRTPIIQAVVELLERHVDAGAIEVDDVAAAAEQFIGLVLVTPLTFAAFGFQRDDEVEDARAVQAVGLFLDGVRPRAV